MKAAPEKEGRGARDWKLGIEEIPEPAFVTGVDHVIAAANDAIATLLGYASPELVGWPLDRIFPQSPPGVSLLLGGDEGATKFEVRARTKQGKNVLMSFLAAPVRRDGNVVGVLYLGRDIRLRKLVEGEVRKSRDYFRSIVQDSPSGICVTDVRRRVVMINGAAESLIGYVADELVGRPVSAFYPDETKAAVDVAALSRGETISREVDLRRKDGTKAPVLAFYRLVEDERGEPMIIESYGDLADRKRLDRLKNEFVFIAAHELRSPVTAIRLLLNLIFEDKRLTFDPVLRDYLLKVQEADGRLMQLVDDLLAVSRSESGRMKIEVSPQDMAAHVEEIFGEARPNALTRDVTLRHAPLSPMPRVMADPGKLREILSNLVANAIKYNVAGGTVTVSHAVRGEFLETSVADTGIGISVEDQARLFEKFWRSEDVAVRAQPGTGLGLFIVKELVERMGGRISVASVPGKGATFSCTLPLAESGK